MKPKGPKTGVPIPDEGVTSPSYDTAAQSAPVGPPKAAEIALSEVSK